MADHRHLSEFRVVRAPAEVGGAGVPPPTGTITFLFTDMEGSTRRWQEDREAMQAAQARHDGLLRRVIEQNGGYVFKTVGDAFCAAFSRAAAAARAAIEGQQALQSEAQADAVRVRMALHSGEAEERDGDYFGITLSVAARLLSVAHAGQVLLSQTTSNLVRDALPPAADLRDLGTHKLKDIARPEPISQLLHPALPAEFPPLRSQNAYLGNLPQALTPFVGRSAEVAHVIGRLETTRLLTLTGTGGIGKTSLALEVAAGQREHYPDGVWLVELAALSSPALVEAALASALDVAEEPGQPLGRTLVEALRLRSLLVVLDNCEHLVDACARLVEMLLLHCPGLRILATSREALCILGELTYRVPSLALPDPRRLPPDPQDLLRFDAVRLFADRAAAAQAAFQVTARNAPWVAQICIRLDGIPLAIGLAASRVRALSPEQIAHRLDDCFHLLTGGSRTALRRQQTLRAVLDWSYDLLTDPEKMLLRRLSVFAGGWTLEAAEAVCAGNGIEEWQVLDLLDSLVNKSLVSAEELEESGRYRLLETVRQYGDDKLREAGEDVAVRTRHAGYFLAFAEEVRPKLMEADQAAWLARLEADHDNLRVAMQGLLDAPDGDDALRLGFALYQFWFVRGHFAQGRGWLTRALARPASQTGSPLRGKALIAAGGLAESQCDYPAARALFEESLAIRRATGDEQGVADTLSALGVIARAQGQPDEARALLEQGLDILRTLDEDDPQGMAFVLGNLAWLALGQGDDERARELYEESLKLDRLLGDHSSVANSLNGLGRVACRAGDFEGARRCLAESLTLRREIEDRAGMAESLESFAALAAAQGLCTAAAQLWGAADARRQEVSASLPASDRAAYDRDVARACAVLGEAEFAGCRATGRLLTDDQAVALALNPAGEGAPSPTSEAWLP